MKKLFSLSMLTFVLVVSLSFSVFAWNDGVYTGKSAGHNGPITVEVTIEDGKISEITILDHSETPYLSDAGFAVTETIIANQSYKVDSISGATVTADAVIAAVKDALLIPDGTYTGTGAGYNGDITVDVVVQDREITDITVVSHSDTPGLSDAAIYAIPEQIIEAQSTVVDTVTGATATSEGIIAAVNNALELNE